MLTKTLLVSQQQGDAIERWCRVPPTDCHKGEVIFDEEVKFEDGMRLAVQAVCSLEASDEPLWTQAVLFTSEGNEVGFTPAMDSFWGVFEVDSYRVNVCPRKEVINE